MRQRKVKNEDEKLAQFQELLMEDGQDHKGKWKELFGNDGEVCLELGCGKGQFLLKMALENPHRNFIGIEGQRSVVLRALDKAKTANLQNIRFIGEFVRDIKDYFDKDEVSALYLNFSDPWPKDRHAKRRLTHRGFLQGYQWVLKEQGTLEFKSDNEGLFAFTVAELEETQATFLELSHDLHASQLEAGKITTEYEEKFKELGKNICYCKVVWK
ncbi:MAG: tRNA (guanosine(46)-N7)-methyltransferase TrmB [Anaerovorax sp.]